MKESITQRDVLNASSETSLICWVTKRKSSSIKSCQGSGEHDRVQVRTGRQGTGAATLGGKSGTMLRNLIVAIVVVISAVVTPVTVCAEEPIEAYLAELQDRGYFDVALRYVDRMATSGLAPAHFKSEIDYRRGSLLVNSARATKNGALKREQLDKAQQAFEEFLAANPKHISAALARSQLGNILVERARGLMSQAEHAAGNRADLVKQASKLYARAYESLLQSRTEIGEQYKSLAGKRDPESKAQREAVQSKYVQTYLAIARVLYEQAKTVKDDKKAYDAKLTAAAKAFDEVAQKYRAYSAGIYALLYEGECYQLMGEDKRALTYFKELLQNADDTGPVRRLKSQALAMSIDSWLKVERNKGPDKAIAMGNEWLKKTRGNEARDPAWLKLRLSLARAYQQKASTTKDDTKSSRALRSAKDIAGELARKRSSVQNEAQQLLVALGGAAVRTKQTAINSEGSASFEEARDAAKKNLDALKLATATIKILSGQLEQVTDPNRQADMRKKLDEAKEQSDTLSIAALELFERADGLATEEDTEERNGVRYYLSFLNYSKQRYRRAAVIAGFVAMHYPDSIAARECANVALASRQRLYQQAPPEQREVQANEIAKLAQLMISRWPGQPQADSAMMTLLDIIVSRGDLAKAEAYLEKIPADSGKRASAELRIGQALWRQYLKRLAENYKADAPSKAEEDELKPLKTRAQQILAQGIERIGSGSPDESTVRAALSLAQIYVDSGESEKALDLLKRDSFGALTLVENGSPWTKRIPALAVEAYKTAIRAHVASAANSGDTAAAIDSARDMLDALRNQLKEQPGGKDKMIPIYISLAKDLERQLSIAAPSDRKALSKGFEAFLRGAAEGNKDMAVQNWVGATFFSLGQGMLQGSKSSPEAQRYFNESAAAYDQVLAMAKSQPNALSPNALTQVRARQAMALRQLGKYQQSVDLFAQVLGKQKKTYLNIQIEAAKTFQRWGAAGNAEAYMKAIGGDKPRADGKNSIWGWGRIAKVVAKNEAYRDTFHEARYNIALSRYKYALSMPGSRQKELFGRARSDIMLTKQLYNLGTKKQTRRYETLLKAIQKSLGQEAIGFAKQSGKK